MSGTVKIHGRDYATVGKRVHDFRVRFPINEGWCIATEIVKRDDKEVVCRATITDPDGRLVATGFAEENRAASKINRVSCLENAETSAIGRALAAAGFTMDGIYASADEVQNAIETEKAMKDVAPEKPLTKKQRGEVDAAVVNGVNGQYETWQQLAIDRGMSVPKITMYFKKKKKSIPQPTDDNFKGFVSWLDRDEVAEMFKNVSTSKP